MTEAVSPTAVFPADFLERLRQLVPHQQLEHVLDSFCQTRLTTLRANTLKITSEQLKSELKEAGIPVEQVKWWPAAFKVSDPQLRQVHHPRYVEGALYVQSLSSMIPPLVLDPQPDERILDLTAAPGSKTTQIAALMNNTGEIVANDLSPVRLFKLQANLRQQGVGNTFVRKGPGQYVWEKYPEYFNRTLADVPCSMEGRFSCDDPDTYEDWSLKKVKELAMRQCHLLRSAVSATKPGGVIVYSTCTLAPEENEAVIDWLLKKEGDAIEVEEISIPGLEMERGVTSWQGKEYHPEVAKTRRILPSTEMEGFFVAKLRKTRSTLENMPIASSHRRHHNHHRPHRHHSAKNRKNSFKKH